MITLTIININSNKKLFYLVVEHKAIGETCNDRFIVTNLSEWLNNFIYLSQRYVFHFVHCQFPKQTSDKLTFFCLPDVYSSKH